MRGNLSIELLTTVLVINFKHCKRPKTLQLNLIGKIFKSSSSNWTNFGQNWLNLRVTLPICQNENFTNFLIKSLIAPTLNYHFTTSSSTKKLFRASVTLISYWQQILLGLLPLLPSTTSSAPLQFAGYPKLVSNLRGDSSIKR